MVLSRVVRKLPAWRSSFEDCTPVHWFTGSLLRLTQGVNKLIRTCCALISAAALKKLISEVVCRFILPHPMSVLSLRSFLTERHVKEGLIGMGEGTIA